jgi:hypothetical protein
MEDGSIQQVDRDELLTALFALRKDLCRKGFDPGLQRVMAAHELLLEMAARGGPVNPAEWEGWLAPLFCSEAKQQDQFKEIFQRWIDRHREIFVGRQRLEPVSTPGTGRAVTDETIEPEGRKGDQSGRAEEKPARSRRIQQQVAAGAGLLLLTLFTGILWLDRTAEFRITGNVFDTVNKSPLSGAVVRVTGQAEVQSGPDGHYETVLKVSNYRLLKSLELEITATNSGYVDKTERRTLNRLNNRETQITFDFALQKIAAVNPLEPDKATPGPAPPLTPSPRPLPKTESFLTVWDILLILSPLLLWLLWQILAALIRTWWLERVSSGVPPDLRTVRIEDPTLELFASSQEQRSLVELRRPRPLDLHDLNLPDTVRKTACNAGIFTPTYQRLRLSPEYLLLIDRLGGRDEQARVGEGLLASLLRNGVYVQPYFFQGDPRLCQSIRRDDEQGPSVTLRYLAGRYPDSRLLLYSDVESFYDSTTGHPRPWLGQFDAWSQRALLTPKPPDRWGYREEGLREHQFSLLPVNSDGLRLLGDWLNYGHLPQPEIKPTIGFPPLVADRPERWIDREPPGDDVVAAMLSEVRSYLGEDGFLWLCACAIYPEVIWELTLAHGYWLFAARPEWSDGRAELILRLVRLPWFRHGYMPDWLRVKLVDHLSSPENRKTCNQIRDNLEQLLLTAVKSPDKIVALEIAVPKRETLHERILTHLRRLGMNLYLIRQQRKNMLRDYVFLSFMTGRQANPRSVRLPELVKQILFRDGKSWLGLRPLVMLVFALVMSGVLALDWWTSKLPELDAPMLRVLPFKFINAHESNIYTIAFSPDGRMLATGGEDGTARIWDVSTGQRLATLMGAGNVLSVAFVPTRNRSTGSNQDPGGVNLLATAGSDGVVRIWDVRTGLELRRLVGHTKQIHNLTFSPDGSLLATASDDQTVRLWDPLTGRLVRMMTGYSHEVFAVAFSPDGRRLATGGWNSPVLIRNVETGEIERRLEGHTAVVWSVQFSPDGRSLASAGEDKRIIIWDPLTGEQKRVLSGHFDEIFSVAFAPDGHRIASASNDRTVRLWDPETGQEMFQFQDHSNQVYSVAFSPDGQTLASGSWDKTVRLYRMTTESLHSRQLY